ncbi:MAG TPA: 3'-5' exonuclease [Burkholderiales bacterium]|nr:3'-5' exonuclease [Burkholderiales bacterium]
MTPVLAFDIETIPDVAGIRRLHDLPADLPEHEVAEVAFQRRRTQTGSDFLPPPLHRVVVISCVLRNDEGVKVFSLEGQEAEIIQRFFEGIEKFVPQLVSWNGGGFDLPVLNYRALVHGVSAPAFWETGDENRDFRYNNYISRYHTRHLDLMDVLAMYQPRNNAALDDVAQLAGFPGKIGIGGAKVWETYLAGDIAKIRDYCEADTANTYLLFLRYQLLRGIFTPQAYKKEIKLLKDTLAGLDKPHWREFLQLWNEA